MLGRFRKQYWYAAGIALVIVLLVAGYTRGFAEPVRDVSYWMDRIAAEGEVSAYEEFLQYINSQVFTGTGRHEMEHDFGKALYAHAGFAGMSVCRWDEAGGCVHEVAGERIGEFSLDALPDFDALCAVGSKVQNGYCLHGIGHGLLSAIGYDLSDLVRVISMCESSPERRSIDSCQSGAFMEYSMRNLLYGSTSRVREPTSDMTEPCGSFTGTAQENCAFTQYVWFKFLSGSASLEAHYRTMGAYCKLMRSLNEISARKCFDGIGYDASRVGGASMEKGLQLCAYASTSDPALQESCVARLMLEIELRKEEVRAASARAW